MRIINLLPDSEQKLIKKEGILGNLRAVFVLAIFSYLVVAAALFVTHIYLQNNASNLASRINSEEQILQNQDQTAQSVQKDNNIVSDYVDIAEKSPRWSEALVAFAGLVPSDVLVTDFSADAATGKIEIQGQALSRDSVLQLRTNIMASPLFKNIDLPLENLEKPANLNFHYTFYLNGGAITGAQSSAGGTK